ncbi:MAG: hypothetical protein R3282_09150 [Rhodothermales bacterium]|nr:hypothetical protein [Rhodothermales bacterium]
MIALIAFGALGGCDTGVDRFSDKESDFAFNLTGALATETDTQFVRVQRIRNTVEATTGDLDATASLHETDTGRSQVLIDSLVTLDSGTADHLLFALFHVEPGHRYELRIEGSNGDVAIATTTVPDRPPTTILPAETFGSLTTQSVSWNGLTRTPEDAVVLYEIAPSQGVPARVVEVPYTLRGRLVRGGWSAELRLSDDLRIVRSELGIPQNDDQAVFRSIRMRLRIPGAEWAQGQDAHNIDGGLGFFGSIGIFTECWRVGEAAIESLGFINGQQS